MFLSKIQKYLPKNSYSLDSSFRPYVRPEHRYKEKQYIFTWLAKNSPMKTFSTVAIHNKVKLIEILTQYLTRHTHKSPNQFESVHQNLRSMGDMICAVPKKIIIEQKHLEGCVE